MNQLNTHTFMDDEDWLISCTNGGGASVLSSTELLYNKMEVEHQLCA